MSVSPKRPKGPPLNAMRAFEAAARHVSFVAAGEELNVTPGAISQLEPDRGGVTNFLGIKGRQLQ